MEKIKAFVAFLEESTIKQDRLGNLGMCYHNFSMDDLIALLAEKHEKAKEAGILGTDIYGGVCHVHVRYEDFQVLTAGLQEIRIEPFQCQSIESEHLFAEVDGILLVSVRDVEHKKMQAQ